jgi:hypothetical protein
MKAGEQFANTFEFLMGFSHIFKGYILVCSLADWNRNSLNLILPSRYSNLWPLELCVQPHCRQPISYGCHLELPSEEVVEGLEKLVL